MAAAPPPAVASSTAVRRRGFGFGVVNEGPVLPYCLESGVRGKLGLGSWLRHWAHVQPAPRRFGRREEKVGFSIVLGRGRSWECRIKHFKPGHASRGLLRPQSWFGGKSGMIWAGAAAHTPLPEISKVASSHSQLFGDRAQRVGRPRVRGRPIKFQLRVGVGSWSARPAKLEWGRVHPISPISLRARTNLPLPPSAKYPTSQRIVCAEPAIHILFRYSDAKTGYEQSVRLIHLSQRL